jgi:hypothetical protein
VNDKKRDIIFEVPKAELPPSVRDLMDRAEARMKAAEDLASDLLDQPLEIDFSIQNDKVLYSITMAGSDVAGQVVLAKSIVRAVQSYGVVATEMKGKTMPSTRVGEPQTSYNRAVCIDWKAQKIFTNFKPSEGDSFLGAMAIVVEGLQGGAGRKDAEEPKS